MAVNNKMSGKTGSAPIIKQGHTTTGQFGNNPDAKGSVREPREIKVR